MSTPQKITTERANQIKQRLDDIHRLVLQNFTYKTDQAQFGTIEDWRPPQEFYHARRSFVGDCDDFALHCRHLIRKEGFPSRLVFCYTETNEGHLVTECHGWILDNRMRTVLANTDPVLQGYNWKWISGYEPGDVWREIISR